MYGVSHLPELIIIVVIALLLLGPAKLPKLGRGIGEMIRSFKQETQSEAKEEEEATPKA